MMRIKLSVLFSCLILYRLICFIFLGNSTGRNTIYESKQMFRNLTIKGSFYLQQDEIFIPDVDGVDCEAIFRNDSNVIKAALEFQKKEIDLIHGRVKENKTYGIKKCNIYKDHFKFILKPINKEEENFPIAYSIIMYKDPLMAERLIRAIYRPQNYYCIHVDAKSPNHVFLHMKFIANCFTNIYLASKRIDVQWGTYSTLESELSCMETLIRFTKWKYYINLTGQEFPLLTNFEIVQILRIFNGANNIGNRLITANQTIQWNRLKFENNDRKNRMKLKSPLLVNVTLVKGPFHIAGTRQFVDYILHDQRAIDFRDWLKDTLVPDETFFSSLNGSPQLEVPGSFTGEIKVENEDKYLIVRFKNWVRYPYHCHGKYIRGICIFGIGDLPLLDSRYEMFLNKMNKDFHPIAYDCLERRIFKKVKLEVLKQSNFSANFYKNLPFVKNHL